MKTFLIITAAILAVAAAQQDFIDLQGYWTEDNSKRDNLRGFLDATGLFFLTKEAALSPLFPWVNHYDITRDGISYAMKGDRGPTNEGFDYVLVADGQTKTVVNGPAKDGEMDTITTVEGDTLFTRVLTLGTEDIVYHSNRTRAGPNTMIHTLTWVKDTDPISYPKNTVTFYYNL